MYNCLEEYSLTIIPALSTENTPIVQPYKTDLENKRGNMAMIRWDTGKKGTSLQTK